MKIRMLLLTVLFLFPLSLWAANWINILGTEKPADKTSYKIFGFIQPEWQATEGTKIQAGPWQGQGAIFNGIRPSLEKSSDSSLFRARLAARGRLNKNINYFIMTDAGNNALTRNVSSPIVITDASLTFDFFGPKIRAGQFKAPTSEEAQQGKFDYINFAFSTNQLVLERYFDGDGSTQILCQTYLCIRKVATAIQQSTDLQT